MILYTVYTQYIEMHSDIVISQSDGRPMYQQIMEQIKQRVAVGEWARGEEIPSIRQLAVALQVSVITVKRAYLELEREGVILTQHGKGSIVAPDPGLGQRLYDEELAAHIDQVARLGALLGLGPDELASRVQEATDQFIAARLASQGATAAAPLRSSYERRLRMHDESAVHFEGVSKRYRHFTLENINLELPTGSIMGFIGANGAGKSTTIRILMGLVHQDAGAVRVLGHAMPGEQAAAKMDIGFVSEDMRLYGARADSLAHGVPPLHLSALGPALCRRTAAALRPQAGTKDQRALPRAASQGRAAAGVGAPSAPAGAR